MAGDRATMRCRAVYSIEAVEMSSLVRRHAARQLIKTDSDLRIFIFVQVVVDFESV